MNDDVTNCQICWALVYEFYLEGHLKWHKGNVARSLIGGGPFDLG